MTTWTPAAEAFFRSYLTTCFGVRPADELAQDLRCHVHEELSQRGVSEVTQTELKQVIDQLGYPEDETEWATKPPSPDRKQPDNAPSPFRYACGILFYIILPVTVAFLEWTYHWCAGVYFDPMPTFGHAALIFMTPGITAWLWFKNTPWTQRSLQVAAALSGVSLVVASYYALVTFWWIPFAMLGTFYFGLGLIPMAPHLALIGGLSSRSRIWKNLKSAQEIPWQRWSRIGLIIGLAALSLLEVPTYVGRIGLSMATSEDVAKRDKGLRLIGFARYEKGVLRACYASDRSMAGGKDIAGLIVSVFGKSVSAREAQTVYFRLTGTPFNEVKPPPVHSRLIRSESFTFDADQGGDRVGARLRGLSMDTSRLDAHVDAAARLSYTEWTLEFDNVSPDTHEARCQVNLPPGGAVSRVTLWINGEPEEAAFGPNAQVKSAYKEVVHVERRDPVLVTVSGPDRVLVQCFPVLPRGRMKIRLGITAPWSEEQSEVILPAIVERNFGYPRGFQHVVWSQGDGLGQGQQTTYTNAMLLANRSLSNGKPDALPQDVWTKDPFAEPDQSILIGKRIVKASEPVEKLVVVLDDSIAMTRHIQTLRSALSGLSHAQASILLASDFDVEFSPPSPLPDSDPSVLDRWKPKKGGIDNLPALLEAARSITANRGSGALVWIHGPQPNLKSSLALEQIVSRWPTGRTFYDVPLTHGTNGVSEALKKASQLRAGPVPCPKFRQRFDAFLVGLTEPTTRTAWSYTRQDASAPLPANALKLSDQFARYATFEEGIKAYQEDPSLRTEWSQKFARYQLVTPISGAVVLERQEQYEAHGLKQVNGKTVPVMPTVPSVPEPSTTLLLLLGVSTLGFRRRRPAA